MDALTSASVIGRARRVVIKIGSSLRVATAPGALRRDWLDGLAADVAMLRDGGAQVMLVSSGSIALGRRILQLPAGALPLEQSQASASVGQIRLAQAYQAALGQHRITAAQVLVTLEDSENRRRYLNSRATLATLLALGAVPIVNENDTVATDEIRYGDNDRLAAQVASLSGADVLVLLSDVDGLYSGDPRQDADARHLPLVTELTPQIEAMAGGTGTDGASGGMRTKLMAARVAMQAGASMVISEGAVDRPVKALLDGARCTWFRSGSDPKAARKQWISAMKAKGALHVDAGAAKALASGKSLLGAGVVAVDGTFERGDAVDITGPDGSVARGLSAYDADEVRAIMGHHSADIADVLGYPGRAALVHRDDMAI